jgi:hypothetical protein
VGAQYQFFTFQLCNPLDIISLSFANDSLFEETFSKSTKESKTSQHLVNAFYRGKINTLYSVQLDFDFLKNINEQTQITQEISNSGNRNLNVLSLTDYSLYAGKLTNSFTGKFGLLEIGSELTRIVGNGYVINTDGYIENNIFSNMETKGALFLNYSHQVCSMDFSAGLRYELSNEKYTEGSMQNTIMDKQYFDCYPSVSLSKQISNAKISISFNKRTQRPNFNQLNGNTVYVNRFLFQKGNPYLKKINIYETDLQATYRTIYLNLGYTYEKDPVTFQLEKQKNKSNAILSTFANFSDYQEIYAIVNFRSKISFWNPNYGFGITKPYFKINDVQYNKANLYFNLYNDFCLPKEFTVSLNFRYRNDYLYYYTENKGYVKLDLSIKKQINNSLRLSLNIYDVFNSVSQMETMKINDIEFKTWKKDETRYVVFSVSYMFNNNIKQYHPSNASGEDLKRF